MSFASYYNNLGINAFAISEVLSRAGSLTMPQAALVLPITAHDKMTRRLSHAKLRIASFEQYFIEHIDQFYNFSDRYMASLVGTVNAVQFLHDIEAIKVVSGVVESVSPLSFTESVGKRADIIRRAAPNIAALIKDNVEVFYLNARIDL